MQNPDSFDKASECAIPLTHDYMLNPHSSVKIFAYDGKPQDQEKYEEYLRFRKELADKIAADVAAEIA